jgi:hypothetical protein
MTDFVAVQLEVDKIIARFTVLMAEAKEVETKRLALENSQIVNTQREQRLNAISKTQTQERVDLDAQKKYIEEQNTNAQLVLNKIALEKEALKDLSGQKLIIEQERLQLEADKKGFETLKAEKDKFILDRQAFEEERKLFSKEKLANIEAQKLSVTREENIKAKEERLDKIERMTNV